MRAVNRSRTFPEMFGPPSRQSRVPPVRGRARGSARADREVLFRVKLSARWPSADAIPLWTTGTTPGPPAPPLRPPAALAGTGPGPRQIGDSAPTAPHRCGADPWGGRGGKRTAARWTGTPLGRGRYMYLLARRRWETTTLPERRANGERLVAARRTKARQQVPMMPYDRADPGPMAPCEVCGRRERVAAFRRHPFQSHVNPTWRCPRHATAP